MPFVHRPVAVGHFVEADDPIENSTRFDPAFEDVWQKLLDVRAGWRRSATDGDVIVERRPRRGHRLILGNPNAANCATRTRDAEGGKHRLLEADALEDGVNTEAAGERAHALDRLVASLAHDISCTELFRKGDPVRMTAQQNDLSVQSNGHGDGLDTDVPGSIHYGCTHNHHLQLFNL